MPRKSPSSPPVDPLLTSPRKRVPHEFVLDALAALAPMTRPMFGCVAIYIEEKIVLILRDKSHPTKRALRPRSGQAPGGAPDRYPADNGVWLATTEKHHESLRTEFPRMRSIGLLGKKITGWQLLPSDAPDFEGSALRACELVLARDPRIGKVPGRRSKSETSKASAASSRRPAPSPAGREITRVASGTRTKSLVPPEKRPRLG